MCLILQDNKERIAEKDITCYKIFYNVYGGKVLSTLFQRYTMTLGREYDIDCSETSNCSYKYGNHYYVEGGCFHSFKTLQGARGFLKREVGEHGPCLIVKCTIPKGTKYFDGVFRNGISRYYGSYASRRITPNELVK